MGDSKNLTLAENAKTQGKHLSIFLADCGRNLRAMLALDTSCKLAVRKRWDPEELQATFKEK